MTDLPKNVGLAVREIKSAIIRAQSRVAANANAEMLSLYFGIGRYVAHKTQTEKWGTGVIDTISRQLQKEMPGLRGFSGKNIRSMRQFYEKWAGELIWPPTAAKLGMDAAEGKECSPSVGDFGEGEGINLILPPVAAKLRLIDGIGISPSDFLALSFSHHMEILSGTDDLKERLFYIRESAQNRWSKWQLRDSIKRDDFHHRGEMPSNFMATIPNTALARKTLAMFRDEYLLDFVNLDDIDAASADRPYVEYAVRDYSKPLGVATYRTADEMPERLRNVLPPIEGLKKQLGVE